MAEGLRQRLRRREVAPLLGLAVTMGAGLLVDRILPPPIPDRCAPSPPPTASGATGSRRPTWRPNTSTR
ncbi:MAG: hypothetical protein ACK59R_05985 [Pseudomonadota bacterium]